MVINKPTRPWFDIRAFTTLDLMVDQTPEPIHDWSRIIQNAVNFILRLDRTASSLPAALVSDRSPEVESAISATLYFPPGFYHLSAPIRLFSLNCGGGAVPPERIPLDNLPPDNVINDRVLTDPCGGRGSYRRCTIELRGDSALSTIFIARSVQWPAIIIQSGVNICLRNLTLSGRNSWAPSTAPVDPRLFLKPDDGQTFVVNGCRDAFFSPHAGVCIDPFYDPGGFPLPRYPNMPHYYVDGPPSSGVLIEDCHISGFVAGIALYPVGAVRQTTPRDNSVALTVRGCTITSTKVAVSLGRGAKRNVLLSDLRVRAAKYAISCRDHNTQSGDCPSVFGATITDVQAVLDTGVSGNAVVLSGITARRCLTIGQLGPSDDPRVLPDSYVFKGCHFELISPHRSRLPAATAHLFNYGHTLFIACTFTSQASDGAPLTFHNGGHLSFQSCNLGGADPDQGPSFWVTGRVDRVSYEGSWVAERRTPKEAVGNTEPARRTLFSRFQRVSSFTAPRQLAAQTLPGSFYASSADGASRAPMTLAATGEAATGASSSLRWVSSVYPSLALNNVFLLVALDGTATFAWLDAATRFTRGDLLVCESPLPQVRLDGGAAPIVVGKVSDVQDNTVTLAYVPTGLQWGLYNLTLRHFPRRQAPTRGTSVVDGVLLKAQAGSVALSDSWAPGHRIEGALLRPGTYVVAVASTFIRLSQEALPPPQPQVDFFDANLQAVMLDAL